MDYEMFIKIVKEKIQVIANKYGSGIIIEIKKVVKNNNVKRDAISIYMQEDTVVPTIYLDNFYNEYKSGRSIENICEDIFYIYKTGNIEIEESVRNFEEWDQIKDNVFYRIINYEMNKDFLRKVPFVKFLDLAIIFSIVVQCDASGLSAATIMNSHLSDLGITKKVLRQTAFQNMWQKYPAVIVPMKDIITELIMNDIVNDEEDDIVREEVEYGDYTYSQVEDMVREEVDEVARNNPMEMYVLTNSIKINGAACITYPNVIKEFAEEHNNDVYIIPSSIHEVILIPGHDLDIDHINEMIREVNQSQVDPIEVLSDHVYCYSRSDGEIHY